MEKLLQFLNSLDATVASYTLSYARSNSIRATVYLSPCEYWEVDFFTDGHIEFQQTTGISDILYDEEAEAEIDKLLKTRLLEEKEN